MSSIPASPNLNPGQIEESRIAQIQRECSELMARLQQWGFGTVAPNHAAIATMLAEAQAYFHSYDALAATLSSLGHTNLAHTVEQVQADLRSAAAIEQETIAATQKSQADSEKQLADTLAKIDAENRKAQADRIAREKAAVDQIIGL